MNYAIVENGVVTNLIWLKESNAGEFEGAVALGDVPAAIGDVYQEGQFMRDGQPVLSPLEEAQKTIEQLDDYVLELELENISLAQGVE